MTKIVKAVSVPGQSTAYWAKTVAQVAVFASQYLGVELTQVEVLEAIAGIEAGYLLIRKFFPKKEAPVA